MYHQIKPEVNNGLCVSVSNFEKQLLYLIQQNYTFITGDEVSEAIKNKNKFLDKSIWVTFDDAYHNFYEHALPILQRLKIPATVFVPAHYIGKVNEWDHGNEPIMDKETLHHLPNQISLGIHCYNHINYGKTMLNYVEDDIQLAVKTFEIEQLNYLPMIAYPFGSYPKNKDTFKLLKNIMTQHKIIAAVRIGNKINPLKLKGKYKLKRLDIRGDENFLTFKRKIKYGKL